MNDVSNTFLMSNYEAVLFYKLYIIRHYPNTFLKMPVIHVLKNLKFVSSKFLSDRNVPSETLLGNNNSLILNLIVCRQRKLNLRRISLLKRKAQYRKKQIRRKKHESKKQRARFTEPGFFVCSCL